jgi:hypothetical protein
MGNEMYSAAVEATRQAAHQLYLAEIAVHDARLTGVDGWIRAANDHLHSAVLEHSAKLRTLAALSAAA